MTAPKRKITKADLLLLLFLTVFTVLSFLSAFSLSGEPTSFTVTTPEGATVYPLTKDCEFTLDSCGVHLTVTVSDGGVTVTSSDCPDRICHSTGTVTRAGQSIVCIPARVVIEINGEEENDGVDSLVG